MNSIGKYFLRLVHLGNNTSVEAKSFYLNILEKNCSLYHYFESKRKVKATPELCEHGYLERFSASLSVHMKTSLLCIRPGKLLYFIFTSLTPSLI